MYNDFGDRKVFDAGFLRVSFLDAFYEFPFGARLLSCAIEKSDMPLADFPLALDSPRADTAASRIITGFQSF